jgi:hypothetical protein
MEYGSMVHALEEIHRLLKSTGVLIDIHPVAESTPLELHQAGRIDPVGSLSVRQWCIDYQQADDALAEIARRGLFVVERETVFDSLTYYTSVEEMRTEQLNAIAKYARDDQSAGEGVPDVEALAVRAEELMRAAASGTELILRERAHISRWRPG